MGQLLMTAAPGLGIGLMPVGKLDFGGGPDLSCSMKATCERTRCSAAVRPTAP